MTIAPSTLMWVAIAPWVLVPLIAVLRMAWSRDLRDERADVPTPTPRVSVIVPARNEAHNVAECVRALLASTYPAVELIVVDDHSTDDTSARARTAAGGDPRCRIISAPDLPPGWFGKQWACNVGAEQASGDILLFVDADTRVAPDAIVRTVNGMQRTNAGLFTVLSYQEIPTFWERVVQPQIFAVLFTRYGGTEFINRSPRTSDKIANGQYLAMTRTAYDTVGGHATVRTFVAEDLKLAQRTFSAGLPTIVLTGWRHITTRMYRNLREIIGGWRKNVYAGGRDAVPFGLLGRLLFPLALVSSPLVQLVPVCTLAASLIVPLPPLLVQWATIVTLCMLVWWLFVYALSKIPAWAVALHALLFPLGAAVTAYIFLSAIAKGQHVTWKGRDYQSQLSASQ